jgi:hypothetical protein
MMAITADDLLELTDLVTRKWAKQRRAEERGRSRASRDYLYSDRRYFTRVVSKILPGAYQHASGNGKYTVSQRQLFYACREAFGQKTGKELRYKYFAGNLLVHYRNHHPETESWKITADPRGNLTIANAAHEVRIPCGTIAIDNHLTEVGRQSIDLYSPDIQVDIPWPSLRAKERYQGVLYIEKEGFDPVLEEAQIAERYDLAILSNKGMSVVAGRHFVDMVCAVLTGVPLLVVHDFDKHAFDILQRLTTVSERAEEKGLVTYHFKNQIQVIDLGLRLADVQKYHLKGERCNFKGSFPADSPCTEEEKAYLSSGRRIELNEFTSPQLVECLESKLDAVFQGKRLLPADDILEQAYRRALVVAQLNQTIEQVKNAAVATARARDLPQHLRQRLEKSLQEDPRAWDQALYDLAQADLGISEEEE